MTDLWDTISAALSGREEVREEELADIVAVTTGLSGDALRMATRATDDVLVAALGGEATLHARPGGWVIHLADATVKGALVTAITAGVLAVLGLDQLPALVLPAVLPLLIDIERVELSASDEHLLARLRLQPDVIDHARSPQQLYKKLPKKLRKDISSLDFLDFVARLTDTGDADRAGDGVIVRDVDDPAWIRVTVR